MTNEITSGTPIPEHLMGGAATEPQHKSKKATKKPSQSEELFQTLKTKFRGCTKASAESIIQRAEVMYEAKTKLGENALGFTFDLFCTELGHKPEGSDVRKMIKI